MCAREKLWHCNSCFCFLIKSSIFQWNWRNTIQRLLYIVCVSLRPFRTRQWMQRKWAFSLKFSKFLYSLAKTKIKSDSIAEILHSGICLVISEVCSKKAGTFQRMNWEFIRLTAGYVTKYIEWKWKYPIHSLPLNGRKMSKRTIRQRGYEEKRFVRRTVFHTHAPIKRYKVSGNHTPFHSRSMLDPPYRFSLCFFSIDILTSAWIFSEEFNELRIRSFEWEFIKIFSNFTSIRSNINYNFCIRLTRGFIFLKLCRTNSNELSTPNETYEVVIWNWVNEKRNCVFALDFQRFFANRLSVLFGLICAGNGPLGFCLNLEDKFP